MVDCLFEEFRVAYLVSFAGGRIDDICNIGDPVAQVLFHDTGKVPRYAIDLSPAVFVAAILVERCMLIEISRMGQTGVELTKDESVVLQHFSQILDFPVQGLPVFSGYLHGKVIQKQPVKQRIVQLTLAVYRKTVRAVG